MESIFYGGKTVFLGLKRPSDQSSVCSYCDLYLGDISSDQFDWPGVFKKCEQWWHILSNDWGLIASKQTPNSHILAKAGNLAIFETGLKKA